MFTQSRQNGEVAARSTLRAHGPADGGTWIKVIVEMLAMLFLAADQGRGRAEAPAASPYPPNIQKILSTYCYDCHGDGMEKGKVAFDEFNSRAELLSHRDLFFHALKNVRADLMPPDKKPRPNAQEQQALADWIKADIFQIDCKNPDPGKVTIRRLNRVEYRNTIRDLTGYDYKVEDELPPDDTGYGFDTIGDVLTLSPLLLEKYMDAAEVITREAVPRIARVAPEQTVPGSDFHGTDDAARLSFYEPAELTHSFKAQYAGQYRLKLKLEVHGQFEFDPGKCRTVLKVDGQDAWTNEFSWQNGKKFSFDINQTWQPGDHTLVFAVEPLTAADKKQNALDLKFKEIVITGPIDDTHGARPKGFERFFWKDPPKPAKERREYAREALRRFANKAYRRPVDDRTVGRLLGIADGVWKIPAK